MRKVINSTYVSLDGVVTNPQEWTFQFRDDTANQFAFEQLMASDALLMGRRTYEVFSAVWPTMNDEAGFAEKMNNMPKHVASRTLKVTTWNATVIQGDLGEAVDTLKEFWEIAGWNGGQRRRPQCLRNAKQSAASLPMRSKPSSAMVATSPMLSQHRLASSVDLRLPQTCSIGLSSGA